MAVKKTGISRDLIIHPGETIADVLNERGISQAELAASTGTSPAYVCSVIGGKKAISANFAFALEYALGVPKSFWLNLQANYDAELLEADEEYTITEEERSARNSLNEFVKYLRQNDQLSVGEKKDESILSLRKLLKISNLANLKNLIPGISKEETAEAFRISSKHKVDPYVLGAWIRMCQINGEKRNVNASFCIDKINELVGRLKKVMINNEAMIEHDLCMIFAEYGIDFSVFKNFRGAPVQGYVAQKKDGSYQMVLTLRNSYADIFWFSLFHELGHIVNGDVSKTVKFVDYEKKDEEKERAADIFACDMLIDKDAYNDFVLKRDYRIEAIKKFAATQDVMPYIVIGRLQKEKKLEYSHYSDYKLRYKWAKKM